jgi:hypothetical protein
MGMDDKTFRRVILAIDVFFIGIPNSLMLYLIIKE